MNTILNVPDLNEMAAAVAAFVKAHQGEKGYILTDCVDKDPIVSIEQSRKEGFAKVNQVKAVRVNDGGELQVLSDIGCMRYDAEMVARFTARRMWDGLCTSKSIYLAQTLYNIATNIEAYV